MNIFSTESTKQFTLDKMLVFLFSATALVSIGSIYLAKPLLNSNVGNSFIIQQTMWFVISAVVVFILLKMGIDRVFSLANVFYYILLFLLVLLALSAKGIISLPFIRSVGGSFAWIQIPKLGSIQPSEFMKIVLVIKAASTITEHNMEKTDYTFASDFKLIIELAKFVLLPIFLIILQPDSGIPIVMLVSLAVMFVLSGARKEWFFIIFGGALLLLLGIVFLYKYNNEFLNMLFGGGTGSYRLNRFESWLDYESDPGKLGFHLYNSLVAQGTAGLTGHPLSSFIISIPEAQTDFIFAVISQNFGFVGASAVIILIFALDVKLILITLKSKLTRERIMMMGIIGMIVFQDFQNISMVLGILPITGITLPFISYGGSSMLSYMIPLAVAFHMHSETQNEFNHA